MNLRQQFFAKGVYTVEVPPVPVSKEDSDVTPIMDQDEVSVICPLNEHGYVSDVLGRALSSDVTSQMRDHLLGLLDDHGDSTSNLNVPDEVKLNLCKLRSCQSPSEMKSYIDALSAWCDANNVATPVVEQPSNEQPSNE